MSHLSRPGVPLFWPRVTALSSQTVVCSGSNLAAWVGRHLSVLMRASRAAQSTLFTIVLKIGALCLTLALVLRQFTVVGTGVFIITAGVGASRGVPAFKPAQGQPPGAPEDSLMDRDECSKKQSDKTLRQTK